MKSVGEALAFIKNALQFASIQEAPRQAEDLLCDLFNYTRADLFSNLPKQLSDSQWEECKSRLALRLKGVPLQYIHGQVEFYGCQVKVNSSVLIPRQETEVLVDRVVRGLNKRELHGQVLWDVCCGSGCIGIALKKQFPELQVYLSDQSKEALNVAKENALLNQVEVFLLEGDLFLPFQGARAHYFICNPPYISEKEYIVLDKEVQGYEPKQALLAGESGLEFYQRLVKELPKHLYPNAFVWLEIGFQQGEALLELFKGEPWIRANVEKDWAGHDRFFSCQLGLGH